jgi:hypothetical protein
MFTLHTIDDVISFSYNNEIFMYYNMTLKKAIVFGKKPPYMERSLITSWKCTFFEKKGSLFLLKEIPFEQVETSARQILTMHNIYDDVKVVIT